VRHRLRAETERWRPRAWRPAAPDQGLLQRVPSRLPPGQSASTTTSPGSRSARGARGCRGPRRLCRGVGRWTLCAQYRPVGRAVRPPPSERRSVDCGGIISRRWMTTRYAEDACSLGPVMGPQRTRRLSQRPGCTSLSGLDTRPRAGGSDLAIHPELGRSSYGERLNWSNVRRPLSCTLTYPRALA
jgi:hypothetical protein